MKFGEEFRGGDSAAMKKSLLLLVALPIALLPACGGNAGSMGGGNTATHFSVSAGTTYPVGMNGSNYVVAVGDFNGDGKLDLAVVHADFTSTLSILLGNGDGTFQAAVDYGPVSNPSSLALGDFNNDGKLDAAFTAQGGSNVSVQLQQ